MAAASVSATPKPTAQAATMAPLAPNSSSSSSSPLPQPRQWDGIPLLPLKALAYRALLTALDEIAEAKTLILDPELAGPLGLVADVPTLKQHGVERMFWIEEPPESHKHNRDERGLVLRPVAAPTRAVVYVVRPESRWIRVIAANILHDRKASSPGATLAHTYHALLSPRRTEVSLQLLSSLTLPNEPSLLHSLTLYDLPLEFVPLDDDVVSLEDAKAWRRIFHDGDMGAIHEAAMALMTMQHIWGLFPRIIGKGDKAKQLASLLVRLRREHLASDPTNPSLTTPSRLIDALVVIDRSVDVVTPLCSQLTYAGLVDEMLGIQSAHVEVDAALLANQSGDSAESAPSGSSHALPVTATARRRKKHRLDAASDAIFSLIRDDNFAVVGERLHLAAKRLNEGYEGRHAAKTVQEMRAFVGRLGGLQSEHAQLRLHTSLTEQIVAATTTETFNRALEVQQNIVAGVELPSQLAAIEELVALEAPMLVVLRLLCLLSVVQGGIKPKPFESVRRELLQTYGYDHLALLVTLERVGLLTKSTPSGGAASAAATGAGASAGAPAPGTGSANLGGFAAARQPLRLINDEIDERRPTDVSYVYSGYAPLSVRLVQAVAQKEALLADARANNGGAGGGGGGGGAGGGSHATSDARETGRNAGGGGNRVGAPPTAASASTQTLPRAHPIVGWRGFADVVESLPGATFDEVQRASRPTKARAGGFDDGGASAPASTAVHGESDATTPTAVRTTVVMFLGGVTQTEVAALRFMSGRTRDRRFLVAATHTMHGDALVRGLAPASVLGGAWGAAGNLQVPPPAPPPTTTTAARAEGEREGAARLGAAEEKLRGGLQASASAAWAASAAT